MLIEEKAVRAIGNVLPDRIGDELVERSQSSRIDEFVETHVRRIPSLRRRRIRQHRFYVS
jgi:hypothetical protein